MSFGHEATGYTVREEPTECAVVGIDPDADSDSDPERDRGRTGRCSRRGRGAVRKTGGAGQRPARLSAVRDELPYMYFKTERYSHLQLELPVHVLVLVHVHGQAPSR